MATPSPLSRWGRFPIFPVVRLSRCGRPPFHCLSCQASAEEGRHDWVRSHVNDSPMVVAVKSSIFNSPSFLSNIPCRIR